MGSIRTRVVHERSDVPARVLQVSHGRGFFGTPCYAAPVGLMDGRLLAPEHLKGIVEVSPRYDRKVLERLAVDEEYVERYRARHVLEPLECVPGDQLIVAVPVVRLKGVELKPRLVGELVAHCTLSAPVDLACTPLVYGAGEKEVIEVVEGFLEASESYNVPVAPALLPRCPRASRTILAKHLARLSRHQRTSASVLFVDYADSNPVARIEDHAEVVRLARRLEKSHGEPVLVYAFTGPGRARIGQNAWSARDLASFFLQVDVVGPSHAPKIVPRGGDQQLRGAGGARRLLLRELYAYVRLEEARDRYLGTLASELNMSPAELLGVLESAGGEDVKRLNARNALMEVEVLRRLFRGQDQRHISPIDYLQGKEAVEADKRIVESVRKLQQALMARDVESYIAA